jgi:hypothetical protein
MVEKGNYDEAIAYATKELAGKKNKKTKHVKALEKAFAKVTARDMELLEALEGQEYSKNWDRILNLTNKIEARQNSVKPFLPLVSKEGYAAHFKFVKTHTIRNRTLDQAAEFRYNIANDLLQEAYGKNNKSLARSAYNEFKNVADYRDNYKDSYALKRDALEFGQVHIKVELQKDEFVYTPFQIRREMERINVNRLNSTWRKYYFNNPNIDSFDYTAKFILVDLDVSPEREVVSHHTDKKKVKNGWKYAKTKNGKNKIDSLGKPIKVDVFKNVKAHITEIKRTKSSLAAARFIYIDNRTNTVIEDFPLEVETNFDDYALQFRGDKRALCNHDINRLKPNPLPFPYDENMLLDATKILKDKFSDELRSVRI